MRKEAISLIASSFVLLVSFQNCQKPPYPDEIAGLSTTSISKVDLGKESLISVKFQVPATKSVVQAGNTYQLNYLKSLLIDLRSGVLTESSDVDAASKRFCLSEDLKNELLNLLKSSQVCNRDPGSTGGSACAMVIREPYAIVVSSRLQFDLGFASDGCGHGSIDLCDDQPVALKAFIEGIKNHYQQLSCGS